MKFDFVNITVTFLTINENQSSTFFSFRSLISLVIYDKNENPKFVNSKDHIFSCPIK